MSTATHQIWLHRLFNSPYFDTWMAVSYLHRYPTVGIHQYICRKIEHKRDVEKVVPQLVHILFHNAENTVSFPILSMLLRKSRLCKSLSAALFFHLRSYLDSLSEQKRLYCKYMLCMLLEMNRQNSRVIVPVRTTQRHRYFRHRTRAPRKACADFLSLEGLLVYFVKAVSWVVSDVLAARLSSFEGTFRFSESVLRSEAGLDLKSLGRGPDFNKSLIFLDELVEITARLRRLPKHIQQKGLEIELYLLQKSLPAQILLPFHGRSYVLSLCIEHSFVLDSASNSPFVLVLEVADETARAKQRLQPEVQTALFLLNQLAPLARESPAESRAIRESIIENLGTIARKEVPRRVPWDERVEAIKKASAFRSLRKYNVVSFIVKSGADFKQELVAYQLLTEMKSVWGEEKQDIWIKNYGIYLVGSCSGIVETITNVCSVHAIKKKNSARKGFTLRTYYDETFSDKEAARKSFLCSLVGYSLVTFFLQVKDRHNGNIMVDNEGHVIHVDFGFIMGEHPGFYNVEKAPFKFSPEYAELLGGDLDKFRQLFCDGFLALRKHSDRLCRIVEVLLENSQLRCINRNSLCDFRDRFKLELCNQDVESTFLLKLLPEYIVSFVFDLLHSAVNITAIRCTRELVQAIKNLRALHLLEKRGQNIYLDPVFRESLIRGFGTMTMQDLFAPSSESHKEQEFWRFEGILQSIVEPQGQRVETTNILQHGELVDAALNITHKGFEFLLKTRKDQVWLLLIYGLQLVAATAQEKEQYLLGIAELSHRRKGMCYRTALPKKILDFFFRLGLIDIVRDGVIFLKSNFNVLFENKVSEPNKFLIVETNHKIYAYTTSKYELSILSLFCKIDLMLSFLVVGVLSEENINRAFNRGITAKQIVHYLDSYSRSLPEAVSELIFIWESQRTRMRITDAYLYTNFLNFADFRKVLTLCQEKDFLIDYDEKRRMIMVKVESHPAVKEFVKRNI
ncbi:UNVERIFIED_CONTAM: hypothetical protein PYX00_011606 [Menopon gallinae]|uniref:General transcription factor IIH subunit 4 n=1 Tax=Menopon gallinae TaxID=328185 RepID=A0AAW2H7X0_9NEOP